MIYLAEERYGQKRKYLNSLHWSYKDPFYDFLSGGDREVPDGVLTFPPNQRELKRGNFVGEVKFNLSDPAALVNYIAALGGEEGRRQKVLEVVFGLLPPNEKFLSGTPANDHLAVVLPVDSLGLPEAAGLTNFAFHQRERNPFRPSNKSLSGET